MLAAALPYTIVTVKGKTDTNGKPFEWQKRTDDGYRTVRKPFERMNNIIRTVLLAIRTDYRTIGKPFERMTKLLERFAK